jgi:hypothetical protein
MPFREPAVASDRCMARPLSERPVFKIRVSRTRRFVKKSDELAKDVMRLRYCAERLKYVLIRVSIDIEAT